MLRDPHPNESVRSEIGRIDAIEGLRAVAIVWVVAFHYFVVRDPASADPFVAALSTLAPLRVWVANGYLGVDLFFLLTGFLLVLPWARHARHGLASPRAGAFYVRRVRRIVPAYYVHLGILFLVALPLLWGTRAIRDEAGLVAYNALAHAFFLHYTTPASSSSLSLNGALWTLTLEAQFYLLLPLLAPRFVRRPAVAAALMLLAAGSWRWLAMNDLQPLVNAELAVGACWTVSEAAVRHLLLTQLPGYLGHFAAGMALGMAWLGQKDRPAGSALGGVAMLAAALALLYWAYALGGGAVLGVAGSWLATLAALTCATWALVRNGPLGKALLAHRPVLFVGRVSYSVYLYHLPLLLVWNRLRILDGSAASLPAYLLVTLLVGWISWRFVEKPFLARGPSGSPL